MTVLAIRRAVVTVALAASLGAASACGDDDDPREEQGAVRATVARFVSAIRSGDGSGACSMLTRAERREVAREARKVVVTGDLKRPVTCEVLMQIGQPFYAGKRVDIDRVRVTGKKATARISVEGVRGGGAVFRKSLVLHRIGKRWQIDEQVG